MKTCIPRRILTECSYIKGLHAIFATTMRSVSIRHWTNELRPRYTGKSMFIDHARIRCSTPPSALRAAPAGTGSAPQRIRQRPKRHETRTPDSTLKWPISGPKDGGRGNHPITSGPMEGTNNKIKTMKRQAYGYRDMEFFKLRIMGIHEAKYALTG